MEIKIEPVKRSEVHLLSAISISSFYDTFHKQNSKEDMKLFLEQNLRTDILEKEITNQANYFFFARTENEIAGYIKLSSSVAPAQINEFQALEIARIYVVKNKIGTGVGKSLMDFAFSFANHHNNKMVWLGVWEHNKYAINFYYKYCFEKFGEHLFMVGNDPQTDWLMKKVLNV